MDRKKSMLRGEYKPNKDDGVGEGASLGEGALLIRAKSEAGRKNGRPNFDELTISDLQRLEELAGSFPSLFETVA